MNHETIKGKILLAKEHSLVILTPNNFFKIDKNLIILENSKDILSLIEYDCDEFKDYLDILENIKNCNIDSELEILKKEKEELFYELINLNLINSGYFSQLTLDNQNNNIIIDYFDLHIFELNSLDDYDSFYKNIKIISNILDSNLNTNISKYCIYQDNSSPNNFYYALFDETSHKNIFVDANFLSHFSEEYIKELELSFPNKTVFNITPSKGNQNSNLLIALQKNIMIDNIYLDVSPLYELIKFGY